jgi:hypothetical protein
MEGWIKLHRKILDHWLYHDSNYFRAWGIMLFTVNYEKKRVLINGTLVDCDRGQAVLSLDSWVEKFGVSKKAGSWTIQKVRTFFDLLEKDRMITRENLIKSTRITICNYVKYQDQQHDNNKQITTKQQPDNNQITTTKEYKERKEGKESKEYRNILMSELSASDVVPEHIEYFEIAKAFYELFKNNLLAAGASLVHLNRAKGSWVDDIRLTIEADGYTVDDLREVWQFLKTSAFWKKNILCTSTLREKMSKLKLEIHNGRNQRNIKEGCTWEELALVIKNFSDEHGLKE